MITNGQSIVNLIKAGKLSLSEIRQTFANASSSSVSVQDWGVCYSSATGELSEYCTVIANNPNDPITGVGMIAYSKDGSSMYCVQYTNDFSSPSVATSVGTTLVKAQVGGQVLCIVYGWTTTTNFYFNETLTIVSCQ
jgi:hypothetical protein